MTLEEIMNLDREFLIPADIAPLLGVNPYHINIQVRQDKANGMNSFCFPTILIGSRVKIPRRAFLESMTKAVTHRETQNHICNYNRFHRFSDDFLQYNQI